jgi:glycine cleavage system transcriptional repressor
MPHVMVAASGPDQPGIVAEFTRVFLERDCNLEDSSMTVLRGHFAMMLVVETPAGVTSSDLESDLSFATSTLGLIVNVWEISSLVGDAPSGGRWIVSIRGADRKGIVHGIAQVLAQSDANIVDVTTRLVGGSEYWMELGVTIPETTDAGALGLELAAAAQRLGVDCSLQHDAE